MEDKNNIINDVIATMSLDGVNVDISDLEVVNKYLNNEISLEQSIQFIKDEQLSDK